MVRERAAAKINLALHVTGRRDDGYHLLDSIVAFADVGDELTLSPAPAFSLTIDGPFASGLSAGDDNLVLKAAAALAAHERTMPRAAIRLVKNLPVASGIGGGSADAAAALRGLGRLANVDVRTDAVAALALKLGADVPVCLKGQACRMSGIGERIVPVDLGQPLPAVLVNPGVPVSTAAVFTGLGLARGAIGGSPLPARDGALIDWLGRCRNDLEAPAVAAEPRVGEVLHAIGRSPGCRLARMSGSGGTCFGLYDTREDAERAARELARPGWWVVATMFS